MFNLNTIPNIFIARDSVDFRKSIDGLVNIVFYEYDLDPYSSSLFIFCNKNKNKLKILHYDHNGFWLYYKKLDKSRFKWPDVDKMEEINFQQLNFLLSGIDIDKQIGFTKSNYKM